jgi:p-aminobenzoyl-glutamate transporter AbgT
MLLIFMVFIISLLVYGLITSKITLEERDEMLNSDEMFP